MTRVASGNAFGVVAMLLAAVLAVGFWAWLGWPRAVPEASVQRLDCASFTPYGPDETPFDIRGDIPPERIDADLTLLSKRFDCVRLYAVDHGQGETVRLAASHDMRVLLGIWIGTDAEANAAQVETAIKLANAHPRTVRAIVVGNEVLLRGDATAEQLIGHIRAVRAGTSVPVTYADVWEFWLRNAQLAREVDFITIHILPFWEDEPVAVDGAIAHVESVYGKVRRAFPGKDLLIGETGWPSAGRMRGRAEPGRLNQARYVREFVAMAAANDMDYNLIEAFDQPWKRAQEGTVGGYWGLFTAQRTAKFDLNGPVSEHPGWTIQAVVTAAMGLLPPLWLLFVVRRRLGAAAWLSVAAASQAAATALVLQAEQMASMATMAGHWVAGGAALAVAAAAAWALSTGVGERDAPAPLHAVMTWMTGRGGAESPRALVLGAARGLALFGAAAVTLGLVFDPRYRDFPVAVFLVPAVGFLVDAWRRRGMSPRPAGELLEEAWLALVAATGAVYVGIGEGLDNHQAVAWCLVVWLLTVPVLAGLRRGVTARREVPS